ncbi:14630_t:CDS:2, partial [Funneliformis geosporum]
MSIQISDKPKFQTYKYKILLLELYNTFFKLEEQIGIIDPENLNTNINDIKTWILNYYDTSDPECKGFLLVKDLESSYMNSCVIITI